MSSFDVIQTFYIDPESVGNSTEIFLTSIELYFKSKPNSTKNVSGLLKPGVTISICDVVNNSPNIEKTYSNSYVRNEYDSIYVFSDASISTPFIFSSPLKLKTGAFYGIVIKFEDANFSLWTNVAGDRLVGTNTPSSGTLISKDGNYYLGNNSDEYKAISSTDLKFKVNVAKFTSNNITIEVVNKNYEFFTVSNRSGNFIGGEYVYQNNANGTGTLNVQTGNLHIVGTGTSFTSLLKEDYIVAQSGSDVNVLKIASITNSTFLTVQTKPTFTNTSSTYKISPVGKVYLNDTIKNLIYLVDSSANSSNKFSSGSTIKGEDSGASANIYSIDTYSVDQFIPKIDISTSSDAKLDLKYVFSYSNGSSYILDTNKQKDMIAGNVNYLNSYGGYILSRSIEVDNPYLYDTTRKSFRGLMSLSINQTNNFYNAPTISGNEIDIFTMKNKVSNTYTQTISGVEYDTEVNKNGIALSKHISNKVSFANNRFAEDIRVYCTAYKPYGTDIRIYAKIHNSSDQETFDDKSWSPLVIVENSGTYSSSTDESDYVEYTYGFGKYSETANSLPGSFKTESGNNVLVASSVDPSSYVSANDSIKIYSPLFPENYQIGIVSSSNSTSITIKDVVSNTNLIGTGFKVDKLKYKNIAFNNNLNDNVCRYYNTSLVEFDKYDSMQIKVVLLSDSTYKVPKIDMIQVIGVSS